MPKNFQISYTIQAIDKASRELKKVEDNLKRLDKSFEKTSSRDRKRNMAKEALMAKHSRNRVSREDKTARQVEAIKRRETNVWAREENRKFRQEKARTRSSIRLQERASREKARIQRRHQQSMGEARGMATTSMAYVTAPTAAASVLSLRNAMNMEQMRIRLLTMFGEEGKKVFKQTAVYAKDTAFSIADAASLITDLKIGASNIGLEKTSDLVQASHQIGNVLLAFSSSRENRQEAVNQLGQIAMSGRGSFRQDILVLNRRGIPIIQAIEKYTGKKYKELQEQYGANLPAKLIYDALLKFSTSPQIAKAMELRKESLTQGWDTFAEGATFFSAKYGDILSDSFGLPAMFKRAGNFLFEMVEELETTGKLSADTAKSAAAFATAWGLTVPALVASSFLITRIATMIGGVGGASAGAAILGRRFLYASSIMGALYLTTTDWKGVIDDIKNDGMTGMIKHFDTMAATALTIYGTVKAIRAAAGIALFAKVAAGTAAVVTGAAAVPTAAVASGVAGSAYGGFKLGTWLADLYDRKQLEKMGVDPTLQDRNRERLAREAEAAKKEGDIKVETTIILGDKKYSESDYNSTTKVTKGPLDNPIIINNMGE